MRRSLPTLVFLALFGFSGIAAAAGVGSLQAEYRNKQVRVSWQAPAGQQVSFYHLYYAGASILGNKGAYDDFEKIEGGKTEFTMTRVPQGPELFIAVLPVDGQGKETGSFTEEVRLPLREGATADATAPAAPVIPSAQAAQTLLLLEKVQSDSATGILLTFSAPVTVPPAQAKNAFMVEDASGSALTLTRLTIKDKTVMLHTRSQIRGATYVVRVQPAVSGKGTAGETLGLDPLHASITFTATQGIVMAPVIRAPAPVVPPPGIVQPAPVQHIPAKNGLPSSGIGVIGVLAASGAIAGWRRMRRK